MKRVDRASGRLAAVGAAAIILTLFVGEGGCELEVGDTLPDFDCAPASGTALDPCPPGFACAPITRKCTATATLSCPPSHPSCPTGMQCDRATARCAVRLDGAGDTGAGHADASVHAEAGTDARGEASLDVGDALPGDGEAMAPEEAPPTCRGLTCNCAGAFACDSGVCIGQDTITTPVWMQNSMASFCTKPCCTSADCSESTVCFAPGTGGNYCVKPSWIGRVAPLGSGIGGAMCKIDSDCQSGLCSNSGTCADTCCSTADQSMPDAAARTQCAAGTLCRFSAFPGNVSDTHYTAWCSPPGNGMEQGASPCAIDGVCASNRCAGLPSVCESACRSSANCGPGMACAYTAGPFMNKDIAAGCVPANAAGALGASCRNNGDCVTNFCDTSVTSMAHCSDVCFSDADCTKMDWHCRPANVTLSSGLTYHILSCGT